MGITRKSLSIVTAGLVDFRSDKERTAAYSRSAKKSLKKQVKLQKELAKAQKR